MGNAGDIFYFRRACFLFCTIQVICWQYGQCGELTALSVIGKPTSQSTSHNSARAVDGDVATFTHTAPNDRDPHPWWKLDFKNQHCLGNIIVSLRRDCCNGQNRFAAAVIRAGLSSNYADNQPCGLPATLAQSRRGAVNDFLCDKPRLARYVSVDINISHPDVFNPILQLAEVEVEEYAMKICHGFDPNAAYFKSVYQRSLIANPDPLSTEMTGSLGQCALYCMNHDDCSSFDFASGSSQCRLYNLNSTTIDTTPSNDSSVYVTD